MREIKRVLKSNNFILFMLMIIIIVVFGLFNPIFLKSANLIQYFNNGVVLSFLALGLSATIITGNFDFSVGSMTGFGTVIMAIALKNGVPLVLSLLIGFISLVLFGVLNGLVVGFLKVPGMLGTLGVSSLIYGIALVLTGGHAVASGSEAYKFFGKSDIGTLPFGIILLAVVFVISLLLLNYSPWGRRLYLIGSSPEVARFTGISYKKEVLLVHVYSSIMCFFGALILGSHMASGRADVGEVYILQAVTASVLGGISIKGGKGSITGALLGAMIATLLSSGFTIINMSQYYKQVVMGTLLIVILFIRNYRLIFNKL